MPTLIKMQMRLARCVNTLVYYVTLRDRGRSEIKSSGEKTSRLLTSEIKSVHGVQTRRKLV